MGAHQGEQHGSLQDPWDFHLLLERVDAKVGRRQPQAASRSMVSNGWYMVVLGGLWVSELEQVFLYHAFSAGSS